MPTSPATPESEPLSTDGGESSNEAESNPALPDKPRSPITRKRIYPLAPAGSLPVDDESAERAFHVWVINLGDMSAVARTMGLSAQVVSDLARKAGWGLRLRDLSQAGSVGEIQTTDFEAAQVVLNRGVSYVQAHRLRELCDRAMGELNRAESIVESLRVPCGGGGDGPAPTRVDLKALTDLARTMQVAHALTANALGDSWGAGSRPVGRPKGGARASFSVGAAMDASAANPNASSREVALSPPCVAPPT